MSRLVLARQLISVYVIYLYQSEELLFAHLFCSCLHSLGCTCYGFLNKWYYCNAEKLVLLLAGLGTEMRNKFAGVGKWQRPAAASQ